MNIETPPNAAFGRPAPGGRRPPLLNDLKAKSEPLKGRRGEAFAALALLLAAFGYIVWALPGLETLQANEKKTEQRVIEIVNQPVAHLPRTAEAAVFSPGWFHPGAVKPDFDTVDVRKTQEFPYDQYAYVTSDVTPSEMFIGGELEFNSMTKYFYRDRTLPKKRLSESQMLEINSLYRAIGSDRRAIAVPLETMAGLLALVIFMGATMLLTGRRN